MSPKISQSANPKSANRVRTAVLLAAGRGTRMGSLTAHRPKPLLEVGGRALIEHILAGLVEAGIERAVVVVGYLGAQIEERLGDGARIGCRIEYQRQERAEGTARALLLAAPLLASEPFVLGWGDILVYPELYTELLTAYAAEPCDALLAVNDVDDPWQGAAVYVDAQWRVNRFEEKPPRGTSTTRWNNAGIHVFRPLVIAYARRLTPSARGEFELPQAIGQMVAGGESVRAQPVRGFWSDVGTPADLARAEQSLGSSPTPRR